LNAGAGGIFVNSGELSGDLYAASLVRSLRSKGYEGRLFGMGGARSAASGLEVVRDSSELHLMGVGEVVHAIPRLIRLRNDLADLVVRSGTGVVVLIDSPDFHLPLASALRSRGWVGRAVCLVTPTVWAWRSGRTRALARDFDLCLPLFGFEHEFLLSRGIRSAWRGHPLVDGFPGRPTPPSGRIVALLPGSRRSEVKRLLPRLLECAALLSARGLSPVFSIAPGLPCDLVQWMRGELRGMEMFEGEGRELLASCVAAAGASGTAAVEAMMLDRFMVVTYSAGMVSRLAWSLLARTGRVSLPNILSGVDIYPELISLGATGSTVFEEIVRYLDDPSRRASVHVGLAAARGMMGEPGASDFWAESVLAQAAVGGGTRR